MHLAFSRSLVSLVTLAAIGAVWASGCSSAPVCDPLKCATGNKCVTGFATADAEQSGKGATEACRLTCAKQEDCPYNYHCASGGNNGTVNYCIPDRPPSALGSKPYVKKDGQWGTPCDPTKGLDNNPACDSAQTFWCYGNAPSDGSSFCTQYQCKDDGDCKGGWWCATVNNGPSVVSATRTFGADQTQTVCLPRAWNLNPNTSCAPCKADLDCPLNDGKAQHCVTVGDAAEKVCAVECTTDKNCTSDASCGVVNETDATVCVPRAGTCKGDGGLCSPCHSDKDCKDGYCLTAEYSTERYCTKKSGVACVATVSGNSLTLTASDCPPNPAGGPVSCFDSTRNGKPQPASPALDQCYGLYTFAGNNLPGCWTKR